MKTKSWLQVGGWACALTFATAGLAVGATHTVSLLHDRFDPSELVIRAGDTVHWVWVTNIHSVESGTVDGFKTFPDGRFRSGDPEIDAEFSLTFDAGYLSDFPSPDSIYPYYCAVHYFEGMRAAIEVIVPGDADLDTDVDLDDVPGVTECLLGPDQVEFGLECSAASVTRLDADADGDVDLQDVQAFQNGLAVLP